MDNVFVIALRLDVSSRVQHLSNSNHLVPICDGNNLEFGRAAIWYCF